MAETRIELIEEIIAYPQEQPTVEPVVEPTD